MMKPARPSRIGMHNQFTRAYQPAGRTHASARKHARIAFRVAARSLPGTPFWSPPPNQARLACALVRRILKFHKSESLLNHPYVSPNQ